MSLLELVHDGFLFPHAKAPHGGSGQEERGEEQPRDAEYGEAAPGGRPAALAVVYIRAAQDPREVAAALAAAAERIENQLG